MSRSVNHPFLAALAGLVLAGAPGLAVEPDPFEGMGKGAEARRPGPAPETPRQGFFDENFTFKKELYSQFSYGSDPGWIYSRQSVGFEALKKFSTRTSTTAGVDVQGRLVRRDGFFETGNDMMGEGRRGWAFEYHNLYADFYNVAGDLGRVNVRAGHFYLPMGLNLQTDTHGTLLQLSNERNVGFERDWYAGFWGAATEDLNYDAYWMLGGGDDLAFRGQSGMLGSRLSLSGKHRNNEGLEGGLAFLGGQRVSKEAVDRSPSVAAQAGPDAVVETLRMGPDARWTFLVPTGSLSLAAELSQGHDDSDTVFTQLYQADYLTAGRRWGASTQYRRFWQDIGAGRPLPGGFQSGDADAALFVEVTRFFRNDIGNTTLDWIKLNVERQLERQTGSPGVVVTLQYYHYW